VESDPSRSAPTGHFVTWLIKIKVRGARPHDRRALHAACLIPRACGSRESHEESQAARMSPRASVPQSRGCVTGVERSSRVLVVALNGVATLAHRHPSPSVRDMNVRTRFGGRYEEEPVELAGSRELSLSTRANHSPCSSQFTSARGSRRACTMNSGALDSRGESSLGRGAR